MQNAGLHLLKQAEADVLSHNKNREALGINWLDRKRQTENS